MLGIKADLMSHTSDHFQTIYDHAVRLIKAGKAYTDDTPQEQMRDERMNLVESSHRNDPVQLSLDRFELMRQGGAEGATWCLRAKIDMKNANATLRDPVIYRCNDTPHHRTGSVPQGFLSS